MCASRFPYRIFWIPVPKWWYIYVCMICIHICSIQFLFYLNFINLGGGGQKHFVGLAPRYIFAPTLMRVKWKKNFASNDRRLSQLLWRLCYIAVTAIYQLKDIYFITDDIGSISTFTKISIERWKYKNRDISCALRLWQWSTTFW